MLNFLTTTSKAGFTLASITAALFWSLHNNFIEAKLFSQMTPEQTYNAFIWSSGIAGFLLLIAILLSTGSNNSGKTISADNGATAIDNSGFLNRFNFLNRKSKDDNAK